MEVKMKMRTSHKPCKVLLPIRIDSYLTGKKLNPSFFGDHQNPAKDKGRAHEL
jgi:hypothetical protein